MKMNLCLLSFTVAAVVTPAFARPAPLQTPRYSYTYQSSAHKYDFAIVGGNNVSSWGSFDSDAFDRLRKSAKGDTLFVRKDGTLYSITDRSIVAQAKAAIEPMQRLGRQQGELGRQQGELGAEQGHLGGKQGELGGKWGTLAGRQATAGEDGRAEIDKEMKALSEQMKKLGEQQQALGEKQKALGDKQKALGRRQAEAGHEAEEKIDKLIDAAFEKGLAHKA